MAKGGDLDSSEFKYLIIVVWRQRALLRNKYNYKKPSKTVQRDQPKKALISSYGEKNG